MKHLIIILTTLLITSCTKNIYYVYVGQSKMPISSTTEFELHQHVDHGDDVQCIWIEKVEIIEKDTLVLDRFKRVKRR
jgi:hypothetical protein